MDEAEYCDRIVMINEGKIAASGAPQKIVREMFPQDPKASLNDVFISLMTRKVQGRKN
jgi:ABC-type hemin transport system ATPase subunit